MNESKHSLLPWTYDYRNCRDDLLEACALALRILQRDGIQEIRGLAFTDDETQRIEAAIAKATGEPIQP